MHKKNTIASRYTKDEDFEIDKICREKRLPKAVLQRIVFLDYIEGKLSYGFNKD